MARLRTGVWLILVSCTVPASRVPAQMVHRAPPPPDRLELREATRVPMESLGGRPLLSVMVNGKGPFSFILDTGAGAPVISNEVAASLNLPALGSVLMGTPGGKKPASATFTRIDAIDIRGVHLEGVTAVFADLSQVLPEAPGLQGILSTAVFPGLLVTFDYPNQNIAMSKGELPAEDGVTVFAWAQEDKLPTVTAKVNRTTLKLHLDSGSNNGFSVSPEVAADLVWRDTPKEKQTVKSVDKSKDIISSEGRLRGTIQVGRYTFEDPVVTFYEGNLGSIGSKVLKDFVVTLDVRNRRIGLLRH